MTAPVKEILRRPVPLAADHFTSLTRTPWAGTEIARRYKSGLVPAGTPIGEAWEFSCDPSFPSTLAGQELSLPGLVQADPVGVLSPALAGDRHCNILVKLLNAGDALSLQVHPTDEDPGLGADECGKPESWYILHCEEGAGLYLGFSRSVEPEELRRLLLAEDDRARDVLQFVPVRPGDYFEIAPGIPHGIGPGITLLEPQRIRRGKSGKTYRLWDWGRRYDEDGLPASQGKPRSLHLEESLALIDPRHQWGPDFVDGLRRQPGITHPDAGHTWLAFPENDDYQLHILRWSGPGKDLHLKVDDGYGVLIPLSGNGELQGRAGPGIPVRTGHPLLLPYAAMPMVWTPGNGGEWAVLIPRGAKLSLRA